MKRLFAMLFALILIFSACGAPPEGGAAESDGPASGVTDTAILPENAGKAPVVTGDDSTDPTASGTAEEKNGGGDVSDGYYGALHVENGRLVSEDGTAVQLRGISTHGLSWFPGYVNADMIKEAKEVFGCNVFRLAMYTAESDGYLTGDDANREALKALIDTAVAAAEKEGMYVIIDWHTLSDGNPLENAEEAAAFFSEMSGKYADREHVIYEICNEPNGGTSWADVKRYAEAVIPGIRKNTDAVVLVGTPEWSQRPDAALADPIDDKNTMYTLHFYAATHKQELRDVLASVSEAGLPLFVSEFGICDASGTGNIDTEQAGLWMDVINEHGISYVMWNLSNKDESSAMIKSGCSKVSGFTDDDLSAAGAWFKSMNTSSPANDAGQGRDMPENAEKGQEAPNGDDKGQSVPDSAGESRDMPDGDESELTATLALQNSWQQGADTFYQYTLTVVNGSGSAVTGWKAHILFSQNVDITDSWNGDFFTNGLFVDVSPAPYNAEIAPNSSVSDIGLILKSGASLTAEEVTVR